MMKFLGLFFVFVFFQYSAQTQKEIVTQEHGWAMYFGNHRLTDKWGVHTEYQWRRADYFDRWQQSLLRLGVDYYAKNGEQYTTIYRATVTKSNDGKAWMGFTSRGSIGNDYIKRADGQIDGTENKDGKSLEQKLKGIGAGEIETIKIYEDAGVSVKQYFVQFTKPEQFPPHK